MTNQTPLFQFLWRRIVPWVMISFSGCGSGSRLAALVNGQPITVREVDQRMARLNPNYRAALGDDRQRLLEEMVMETALIQEARRRGLDRDPEAEALVREASRQILLGRLLEVIRQSENVAVTDDEIAQFYKANEQNFTLPETFRASHILVDDEETAKKALERLKGGEPFAKVAEELSKDPTKAVGGDIGDFTKGQLIPEFEAAAMKLKPGEMSPLVKSSLGYHIILLTGHKIAGQRPLEDVKEAIRRQLVVRKQQGKTEEFVRELRAKAQVKLFPPFGTTPPILPKKTNASSQGGPSKAPPHSAVSPTKN